jgi:hypothetical protein
MKIRIVILNEVVEEVRKNTLEDVGHTNSFITIIKLKG